MRVRDNISLFTGAKRSLDIPVRDEILTESLQIWLPVENVTR